MNAFKCHKCGYEFIYTFQYNYCTSCRLYLCHECKNSTCGEEDDHNHRWSDLA